MHLKRAGRLATAASDGAGRGATPIGLAVLGGKQNDGVSPTRLRAA